MDGGRHCRASAWGGDTVSAAALPTPPPSLRHETEVAVAEGEAIARSPSPPPHLLLLGGRPHRRSPDAEVPQAVVGVGDTPRS